MAFPRLSALSETGWTPKDGKSFKGFSERLPFWGRALDRLDVVILVSGDGDFQRLVEMAQGKGVRVEVASVGMSTASNLRHAADEFIDLGSRVRDIRV